MNKELLKGCIDILILSLILKKDMYGYDIAKTIKEKSGELYEMGEGTLYPALKRLENKSFLKSYWKDSTNGVRRKYYTITQDGTVQFNIRIQEWNKIQNLIIECCKED